MNQGQSGDNNNTTAKQAVFLNIIWMALVAALFVYGAMLFILVNDFTGDGSVMSGAETLSSTVTSVATLGLATVSMLNLWLAHEVRRRMLSGPYVRKSIEENGGSLSRLSQEEAAKVIMPKYFMTMIILWAIVESIALFGFVIGLLTRDFSVAIPFILAAAVAMFYYRPSARAFDDVVKSARTGL